ncbi:hypothetical protein KCU75_g31, partial [Aureobasidium melanogenum]
LTSVGGDRIIVVELYCALPLYGVGKLKLSGLVEENSRNVPTVENIHISTNEPPTALSTHPWYSLNENRCTVDERYRQNKHVYYVENEVGERV